MALMITGVLNCTPSTVTSVKASLGASTARCLIKKAVQSFPVVTEHPARFHGAQGKPDLSAEKFLFSPRVDLGQFHKKLLPRSVIIHD